MLFHTTFRGEGLLEPVCCQLLRGHLYPWPGALEITALPTLCCFAGAKLGNEAMQLI